MDLFSACVAFFVTFTCIVLLKPLANRLGLVDAPTSRKCHQGDIPLIGGLAMFMGFLVALLTLPISLQHYRSFIAGSALLVFVGLLDDFHELSPKSRFLAQIFSLLLMFFWGGIKLTCLGDLFFFKAVDLGWCSLSVSIIAGLGIINAINMVDGMDGLAGTLVCIELMLLMACAILNSQSLPAYILSLMIAVVLAFLWFNFPTPGRCHRRVFMGDAGSLFLGFALVWFLIELSQTGNPAVTPVTMLWIMGLPLFDTAAVMIYRLSKKQSIFAPDRQHGHHLLAACEFSATQVCIMLGGTNVVLGILGLVAYQYRLAEGILFLGFLMLFVLYLLGITYLRVRLAQKNNSVVFVRLLSKN